MWPWDTLTYTNIVQCKYIESYARARHSVNKWKITPLEFKNNAHKI